MAEALLSPTETAPRLNIVILVVGSRGDVQPFLAYGQELKSFGHRVRLATHKIFQKVVIENGLEYFPLAGNPDDLMAFMVKNGGIFPSISSFLKGDVWRSERTVHEILKTTWYACICDDEQTGVPFVANAIIANPPSFGHIHCAEKLGIPLHIVFTTPWSATVKFPHPFTWTHRTRIRNDRVTKQTYATIDYFTWVGTFNVINHFRVSTLKLAPLNDDEALTMMTDVPHTYCWSPSLVAKPDDWGRHIDVCGFFFVSQAVNYKPPEDLLYFLANGSQPLYIGFGSIVGYNQRHLFRTVRDALKETGRRAVICRKLVTANDELPDNMFSVGDCPHEWLFQQVDGVCHHGGAGTTAAGLRVGLPTIVVAFFGDQFFWGDVVEKAGAGPSPLSGRNLKTVDLVNAIRFISANKQVREKAQVMSQNIKVEQGCKAALDTFHGQLPLKNMRSDLESTYVASVRIPQYRLQVSWPVAQVLLEAERITPDQVVSLVTREWILTNSNIHSSPLQLRIPGKDLPYSTEKREQILSNFDKFVADAQVDSQETTSLLTQGTRDMNN